MTKIITMSSFVFDFQDVDKTKLEIVGSKGANLGELSKIEGINVPDGFCISTEVFQKIVGEKTRNKRLTCSVIAFEDGGSK